MDVWEELLKQLPPELLEHIVLQYVQPFHVLVNALSRDELLLDLPSNCFETTSDGKVRHAVCSVEPIASGEGPHYTAVSPDKTLVIERDAGCPGSSILRNLVTKQQLLLYGQGWQLSNRHLVCHNAPQQSLVAVDVEQLLMYRRAPLLCNQSISSGSIEVGETLLSWTQRSPSGDGIRLTLLDIATGQVVTKWDVTNVGPTAETRLLESEQVILVQSHKEPRSVTQHRLWDGVALGSRAPWSVQDLDGDPFLLGVQPPVGHRRLSHWIYTCAQHNCLWDSREWLRGLVNGKGNLSARDFQRVCWAVTAQTECPAWHES